MISKQDKPSFTVCSRKKPETDYPYISGPPKVRIVDDMKAEKILIYPTYVHF
jgi:hypothetical protein